MFFLLNDVIAKMDFSWTLFLVFILAVYPNIYCLVFHEHGRKSGRKVYNVKGRKRRSSESRITLSNAISSLVVKLVILIGGAVCMKMCGIFISLVIVILCCINLYPQSLNIQNLSSKFSLFCDTSKGFLETIKHAFSKNKIVVVNTKEIGVQCSEMLIYNYEDGEDVRVIWEQPSDRQMDINESTSKDVSIEIPRKSQRSTSINTQISAIRNCTKYVQQLREHLLKPSNHNTVQIFDEKINYSSKDNFDETKKKMTNSMSLNEGFNLSDESESTLMSYECHKTNKEDIIEKTLNAQGCEGAFRKILELRDKFKDDGDCGFEATEEKLHIEVSTQVSKFSTDIQREKNDGTDCKKEDEVNGYKKSDIKIISVKQMEGVKEQDNGDKSEVEENEERSIDVSVMGRVNLLERKLRLEELKNKTWIDRMKQAEETLYQLNSQLHIMDNIIVELTKTSNSRSSDILHPKYPTVINKCRVIPEISKSESSSMYRQVECLGIPKFLSQGLSPLIQELRKEIASAGDGENILNSETENLQKNFDTLFRNITACENLKKNSKLNSSKKEYCTKVQTNRFYSLSKL